MKPGFAQILSALRRENNLSQKKAADNLGISQALLSHYENGVREPKLEFIMRACEYYGVSTDYILGRTTEKSFDGVVALRCTNDEERRTADVVTLIMAILSEIRDEQLRNASTKYLGFSVFAVLAALRAPTLKHEPFFDAARKTAEAVFVVNAHRVKANPGILSKLTIEALKEKYPDQYLAMMEMEESIEKAVTNLAKE